MPLEGGLAAPGSPIGQRGHGKVPDFAGQEITFFAPKGSQREGSLQCDALGGALRPNWVVSSVLLLSSTATSCSGVCFGPEGQSRSGCAPAGGGGVTAAT